MNSSGQGEGTRQAHQEEWTRIQGLRSPGDKAQVEAFIAKLKARDVEKEMAAQAGGGGGEQKDAAWYQAKMQESQQKMVAKMQAGVPYTDPEVQGHMQEVQRLQQEYIKMVSDPAFAQAAAAKKKAAEGAAASEKRWTSMMIANAELKLSRLSSGAGGAARPEVHEDLDASTPPGLPPGWWVRVPRWMVNARDLNDPEELPVSMEAGPDGWVSILMEPAPTSVCPTEQEYYKATERDPVSVKYGEPKFVFKVTVKNESERPVELGTIEREWFHAHTFDNPVHGMVPWAGYTVKPEFKLDRVSLPPGQSYVRYIGYCDVPLGESCFPADRLGQMFLNIRRRHTYITDFRRTAPFAPPPGKAPARVAVEFKVQEFREGKRHDVGLGIPVKYVVVPAHTKVRTSLPQEGAPRTFYTDRDLYVPLRLGRGRVRATSDETGTGGLVDAGTVNSCDDATYVEQVLNPEPSYFEHEGPRRAAGAAPGTPSELWKLENVGFRPLGASRDLSVLVVGTEKGFRILDAEGYALSVIEPGDAPKAVAVSGAGDLVVVGLRRKVECYDVGGNVLWSMELKKDVVGLAVSETGDRIYVTCRNDDLHLLSRDGKLAWSKEISNADAPLATNRAGDRALLKTTSAYLYLDANAQTMWKFDKSYHGEYPGAASMSGDGSLVAIGSDKNMYLLDGSGKELFKESSEHVKSCAVAAEAGLAALSNWAGNTFLVDRSGKVVASLQTAGGDRAVALARDGRSLLILSGGALAKYSL